MKRNYHLPHRLVAYILFVGLFLQSCGGFQNPIIPQEGKQPSRALELTDHSLINTKEFVTSGGYLASFYKEDGVLKADLKANEQQPNPNYKAVPVVVEPGTNLTELTKLDPTTQRKRIELNRSNSGQLKYVTIRAGGVPGGMMEGSQKTASRSVKLTEVKKPRKYFFKGILEITPANAKDLLGTSGSYADSFMNYDGMLSIKNWGNAGDLAILADILQSFSKVTKLKVSFLGEGEKVAEFAEIIARAVQFYEQLIELDISECQLEDGLLEDIMESVHLDKLRCINIANNNLSSELIAQLQEAFPGIEFVTQASVSGSLRARLTSLGNTSGNSRRGDRDVVVNSPQLSPNNSVSLRDRASEKMGEKDTGEKEALPFYTPSQELTAYERMGFNKFSLGIPKGSIAYGIQLGRGGMGAVYQGTYQGKIIAVKKLLCLSEEQIAVFQKEALIMSNYRHRNLISFLGYCPEEHAFMMEYASGGSLWSLLKSDEAISWENRYEIGLDVAKGMEYLHDNGVVHCALKSDNILLDRNRRAKITDFGISALKKEHVSSGKSTYGEWGGGTYYWMAPEIFHTDKNTKAGDVYSYGMVLWQLGSRKKPFAGIEGILPYISAGNKEVITTDTPPSIKQVIELCWLPEPPLKKTTDTQDRPTMQAVRLLLEQGMEEEAKGLSEEKEKALEEEQVRNKQLKEEKEKGKQTEVENPFVTLLKQAEGGDKQSQYDLGCKYVQGEGVKQDLEKAVKWYRQAASQGHSKAKFKLGMCYEQGKGVTIDYQEAFKWHQQAADQGKVIARAKLARMYHNGWGVKKDLVKSNEMLQSVNQEIKKRAEQGKKEYQFMMGWMYGLGQGVELDDQKAVEWYQKAAEQEYAVAQYNLGLMYQNGQGVQQDYQKALAWYQKAAEQGHAVAQNNLGWMYQNSQGVRQDYQKALAWYQKAVEQEYAVAQYNLGWMYQNGLGVRQDYQKALAWYQKAAEQGYAVAQYNLGVMYDLGQGVEHDYQKAVEWYQKAAEQGHAVAQNNLGVMYKSGQGVRQDYQRALEWLQKAAEQGYAVAQNNLGAMYKIGQGIRKDYQKAVEWYQKAAEQGHAGAQTNLGWMYQNGQGVRQDYQKALEWYQKAADQEYAVAQYTLGWMYQNGQGVQQDYQKAVKWHQKAAEQGYAVAQYALGLMYAGAQGVTRDKQKAKEWYQKAADQEYAVAQYTLGWMYQNGQGVRQDYQKALEWYQKAAQQGLAEAQYALGLMYADAQGVTRDKQKAKEWLQKAAEQGHENARAKLATCIIS